MKRDSTVAGVQDGDAGLANKKPRCMTVKLSFGTVEFEIPADADDEHHFHELAAQSRPEEEFPSPSPSMSSEQAFMYLNDIHYQAEPWARPSQEFGDEPPQGARLISPRDLVLPQYDPDFGAKVCERFQVVQDDRERRYGRVVAEAFPAGQTPVQSKEAYQLAQEESERLAKEAGLPYYQDTFQGLPVLVPPPREPSPSSAHSLAELNRAWAAQKPQ